MMLKALFISLRPRQWIKNLILYAGFLFSMGHHSFDPVKEAALFGRVTLAFFLFCLLTGSVYLFNDIFDRRQDARHPVNRNRPIAADTLPVPVAWIATILLLLAVFSVGFALDPAFSYLAIVYFLIFVLYTLALKRVVILDTIIVAIGFVLRAFAGTIAAGVQISVWLVICTFFLALLLGFGKRRSEIAILGDSPELNRYQLRGYRMPHLDLLLGICAILAVVSYTMYALSDRISALVGPDILFTLPFVIFGIFRYLFLVVNENAGDDPVAALFSDSPLLITVIAWLAVSAFILTVHPDLLRGVIVQ